MNEQEGFRKLKAECIRTGLCYECGACEAVCPNGALKLRKYPWCRNPELVHDCVEKGCDLCYRACAAREVPLTAIETKYFGRTRRHCFPGKVGDYPNDHDEDKCGIVRNVYTGVSLYRLMRLTNSISASAMQAALAKQSAASISSSSSSGGSFRSSGGGGSFSRGGGGHSFGGSRGGGSR